MEWSKCWGTVINKFSMNIRWHLSVDITLSHEKAELNVDVCVWLWRKHFINIWFDGERATWKWWITTCFNIKSRYLPFIFCIHFRFFWNISSVNTWRENATKNGKHHLHEICDNNRYKIYTSEVIKSRWCLNQELCKYKNI